MLLLTAADPVSTNSAVTESGRKRARSTSNIGGRLGDVMNTLNNLEKDMSKLKDVGGMKKKQRRENQEENLMNSSFESNGSSGSGNRWR